MKLNDIMTHDPETVEPNATVREAAEKMKERDIGGIPVRDAMRVLGMITDRDIAIRCVAQGLDPARTPVADVMTAGAVTCPEDADIREAMDLMEEKQIRRLIVTDGRGSPAGIVSLGDLALHLRNKEATGEVLTEISKPAAPVS